MVPFLVAIGLIGILVACGVGISLYLFQCGAIGRSFRRSRRLKRAAVEVATNDDSDNDGFMVDADVDVTSRYTRNSILFLFGGLVVIGILLASLFNAVIH